MKTEKTLVHRLTPHLVAFCLTLLAAACGRASDTQAPPSTATSQTEKQKVNQDKRAKEMEFNVVMLSYYERPIFDVRLNGMDVGVAGAPPHRGTGGLMTGVAVPLGPQKITWRLGGPEGMPGNGATVVAKNTPELADPGPEFRYLGVHVYPDDTVEVIPEKFWPTNSPRGKEFLLQWEKKHGQSSSADQRCSSTRQRDGSRA
jgi:hypothetical protein